MVNIQSRSDVVMAVHKPLTTLRVKKTNIKNPTMNTVICLCEQYLKICEL